jgi:hypothetical protein
MSGIFGSRKGMSGMPNCGGSQHSKMLGANNQSAALPEAGPKLKLPISATVDIAI